MSGSILTRRSIFVFIAGLLAILSLITPAQSAQAAVPTTVIQGTFTQDAHDWHNTDSYFYTPPAIDVKLSDIKMASKILPKPPTKTSPLNIIKHFISRVDNTVDTGISVLSGSLEAKVLEIAYFEIDKPYIWGATGPNAFDCSGLVYYAYHEAGFNGITRTTYTQYAQSEKVSQANALPGDLVFFSSGSPSYNGSNVYHVGIYLGHGMMIDAPHSGSHVQVQSIQYFGTISFGRI